MWIVDLTVKGKTIKLMDDNTEGYLHVFGLGVGKDFLQRTQNTLIMKENLLN